MKHLLLLLLALIKAQWIFADFIIEGKVQIDSSWNPVIYLCIIPSFEEMHTVSNDMIIAQERIDSQGYFKFNGDYLPKSTHLYRLHISKKNDPPSTIIIGGKEENHEFIFADNDIHCTLRDTSSSTFLSDLLIEGGKTNLLKQEIDKLIAYYEHSHPEAYPIGKRYMKMALDEKLRYFADSCSYPLISLYALYQTHFEAHAQEDLDYYHNYMDRWQDKSSTYFVAFNNRLPTHSSSTSPLLLILISGFIGLLLGISFLIIPRIVRKRIDISNKRLYNQLSIQERKILTFLQEGKTNKEISQSLHIGLSTVKSHVHSIYSKLGIKSRKEAINFRQEN